jgi:hypothetical protein
MGKLIEVFQPRHSKLAELMLRAEDDVLACKTFPHARWWQIHSTNPLERLKKEIKRRTNVVGIFPNEAAISRLVGALMLEQNDEWAVTRRYMTLETVAVICKDNIMDPAKIAALQTGSTSSRRATYTTYRSDTEMLGICKSIIIGKRTIKKGRHEPTLCSHHSIGFRRPRSLRRPSRRRYRSTRVWRSRGRHRYRIS